MDDDWGYPHDLGNRHFSESVESVPTGPTRLHPLPLRCSKMQLLKFYNCWFHTIFYQPAAIEDELERSCACMGLPQFMSRWLMMVRFHGPEFHESRTHFGLLHISPAGQQEAKKLDSQYSLSVLGQLYVYTPKRDGTYHCLRGSDHMQYINMTRLPVVVPTKATVSFGEAFLYPLHPHLLDSHTRP